MQQFDRITIDPGFMGGKPCIRGMRVTVGMIVAALAGGHTIEQLLADFPYLEEPDIREALAFAARLAQGYEIQLCGLMRLLIDMNLTPRWIRFLRAAEFTLRPKGDELLIRPISARYMHKKEIDAYEKENPGI